jgi:hypothetical protein
MERVHHVDDNNPRFERPTDFLGELQGFQRLRRKINWHYNGSKPNAGAIVEFGMTLLSRIDLWGQVFHRDLNCIHSHGCS